MRIAQIIGTVTLNRLHPSLAAARLKLAAPLSWSEAAKAAKAARNNKLIEPQAEPLVVYDELGAGIGSLILMSEGPEAARPFHPEVKPIDAYNAAIIDVLDLRIEPTSEEKM